jgi:hypothetical protein
MGGDTPLYTWHTVFLHPRILAGSIETGVNKEDSGN